MCVQLKDEPVDLYPMYHVSHLNRGTPLREREAAFEVSGLRGRGSVSSTGGALHRIVGSIRQSDVDPESFKLATQLCARLAVADRPFRTAAEVLKENKR